MEEKKREPKGLWIRRTSMLIIESIPFNGWFIWYLFVGVRKVRRFSHQRLDIIFSQPIIESYNGKRSIETILLQPPVTILSIANNYLTPNRWASSRGVPIIYQDNNNDEYFNKYGSVILFRIDLIYYWSIVRGTSESIDGIRICSVINEELDHLSK